MKKYVGSVTTAKPRKMIALFLAIVTLLAVPFVAHAYTHTGHKTVDGFSINYGVTANATSSSAFLSCPGTTSQNPKPQLVEGSIRIRMCGNDDIIYISFDQQVDVEYGEQLYIYNAVSAPSGVSFVRGVTLFSFLDSSWRTLYQMNA